MSNKTPNAKKPKTASERNKLSLRLGFLLIIVVLCGVFLMAKDEQENCTRNSEKTLKRGCLMHFEYAITQQQQETGLSNRASMPDNVGMLFIFNIGRQCMWMKDMRFNLDIVWINQNNQIIKILKDIAPTTYPQSFCADGTKYVLELNSGRADELGLGLGDFVRL